MRILTRYILREVLANALIGVAVFTFVLFTRDLGRVLELVVRASATTGNVLQLILYTIPLTLTYTIPMAVLVGILIGLSRLAADSEITAMRASGMGVWNFLAATAPFILGALALALLNGLYLAPASQAALLRLEADLKTSQASFEIQPRVFYEGFPKLVLYVQDVHSAQHAAVWKGVFLADVSDASNPRITLAREGILVAEGPDRLHLQLSDGSTHESDPNQPDHYQISTFARTDIPIDLPTSESKSDEPAPASSLSTPALITQAAASKGTPGRWYAIELHRRIALPLACLVLALVGVPLGLSSKKGGKSAGFVLTILLVFGYYIVSLIGVSLARQGRISPWLGAWSPDLVFLAIGIFLLWRSERRPIHWTARRSSTSPTKANGRIPVCERSESSFDRIASRRRLLPAGFPTLLDDYLLRDFFLYLGMIMASFVVMLVIFTLFELLGDILRNQIPVIVVAEYLLNVAPYLLYGVAPLVVLLAVLVTFGVLQRANEITAMKASGISLYRVAAPVLVAAAGLAVTIFLADQFYLPHTNRRQEELHNRIKGKPAQTYLLPDRKWIFGQNHDIYYYQFFDPDRNQFARLTLFEIDPATFSVVRRIHAERAHWEDSMTRWVYEQGWQRTLRGAAIAQYQTFDVSTFPEGSEPPSYFKKEVRQYSEMNYQELRRYIRDLQQSGFDVVRLRIELNKKLAYPAVTLVMAVLAIPFALSSGQRGAVTGVATAVGIAVVYTVVSRLFESMGNLGQLPAGLAAWSPDLVFGMVGAYMILKLRT